MADVASVSDAMLGSSLWDTAPLEIVSSLTGVAYPVTENGGVILTRIRPLVNALSTATAYCMKERTNSEGVFDG
jgi:hypothetical protein